jgi:hypothetical protein
VTLVADAEAGALLLVKVEPGTKLSDQLELPPFGEIAALATDGSCKPGPGN